MAQSMADRIAQDARLAILKELTLQVDGRLNDLLLQKALDSYGFRRDRDWVKTQLRKLESLGAVSLVENGPLLIARIEPDGRAHVDERAVLSGVTRPALGQ